MRKSTSPPDAPPPSRWNTWAYQGRRHRWCVLGQEFYIQQSRENGARWATLDASTQHALLGVLERQGHLNVLEYGNRTSKVEVVR